MTEADRAGAVLEIDLGAIVANWRYLCTRHPWGAVGGVVKADAYGLGARMVAPALHAAGCQYLFTALLDEALAIRHLVPGATLIVLNGPIPNTEAEYLAHDLVPVLNTLAEIDAWAGMARAAGWPLPAILHIDTGMARLGLDNAELRTLQQDHRRLDGITILFVMTHLVSAELPDDPLNAVQARRFAGACAGLPRAPRSFANSSGIFLGETWGSDLARPGAALYGINPTLGQCNPMRPTVRLRARVLGIRAIESGEGVGYNAIWHATRPTRIATAAIGYADGWHRSQSNQGWALFDGERLPLVGRVSMDLATFDVTKHPRLRPGDWLELIGPGRTPDDVAIAAGTNGYEVLTSLGRRFHRLYRNA